MLRVSRKVPGAGSCEVPVFGETNVTVKCVYKIKNEFKFKTMAEYQHTRAAENPRLAAASGIVVKKGNGRVGVGAPAVDAEGTDPNNEAALHLSNRNTKHVLPFPDGPNQDPFHVAARAEQALTSLEIKNQGDDRKEKTVGSLICVLPLSTVQTPEDYLAISAANGGTAGDDATQNRYRVDDRNKAGSRIAECSFNDANVPAWPFGNTLDDVVASISEKILGTAPSDFQNDIKATVKFCLHLFDTRPVWPQDALVERCASNSEINQNADGTSAKKSIVEKVLPHIAFRFTDGPFRRLWVKKGCDPRDDANNGKLQVMEMRLDSAWFAEDGKFVESNGKKPKKQKTRVTSSHAETHCFKALPLAVNKGIPTRYPRYQLCDVLLPAVQSILRRMEARSGESDETNTTNGGDGKNKKPCRPQFGFFTKFEYDALRACVSSACAAIFHDTDPIVASNKALKEKEDGMEDGGVDDIDDDEIDAAGDTKDEDGDDSEDDARTLRKKAKVSSATETAARAVLETKHTKVDLETLVRQSANLGANVGTHGDVDGEMEYDVFDGSDDSDE